MGIVFKDKSKFRNEQERFEYGAKVAQVDEYLKKLKPAKKIKECPNCHSKEFKEGISFKGKIDQVFRDEKLKKVEKYGKFLGKSFLSSFGKGKKPKKDVQLELDWDDLIELIKKDK